MNCGSDFFSEGKIYEWIGRYTHELGFRFFFGIINIYFIFCIGGLGCWNLKIYEWIGRYTNELGFRFFFGRYTNELEDIRMNWGSDFFFGKYTSELEDIRMNWGSDFFWNNKYLFYILYWRIRMLKSEDIRMNWKIYEWIGVQIFFGRYTNELEDIRMNCGLDFFWKIYEWIGRYTHELGFRFFFWNSKYLFYT